MTTPTRFTAEELEHASATWLRDWSASRYGAMLRQAAEQARTLEQIRKWTESETYHAYPHESDATRVHGLKRMVKAMLDGETAR